MCRWECRKRKTQGSKAANIPDQSSGYLKLPKSPNLPKIAKIEFAVEELFISGDL
jgi:hypothetical protein